MPKNTKLIEFDQKRLARAARATYETWIKEAGFQNDARVKEWGKLNTIHQGRWTSIARAVIKSYGASGDEDQRGDASGVRHVDARPDKLRHRIGEPTGKVPPDRNRGARRRRKGLIRESQ